MAFSRFSHFLRSRTSVNPKQMRAIIRNQFFVYSISQRIKNFKILYNFYLKRFQEQRLIGLFRNIRASPLLRNRAIFPLISAAGLFSIEDWNNHRIRIDDEVRGYFDEFDNIDHLRKTKTSPSSMTASCFDRNAEGNFDCMHDDDLDLWEFYVQKDNMITWRRDEGDGNYVYKVYVKYDDITAEDFLFVQTNVDYRREWDNTAVKLDVVDSDPEDDQQIIYWEMLWPRLFANRDYVFIRKYFIDRKKNLILICCKSLAHPQCPEHPHLQRVKDYWSYMVIKPTTTFSQRGFEFILTYYDNPGIKIPKYITNYVAQRQLPDFIDHLYHATKRYAEKKLQESYKNKDPGYEYPADVRLDNQPNEDESMQDNVNKMENNNEFPSSEKEAGPAPDEDRRKSWWSYIIPFNYLQ